MVKVRKSSLSWQISENENVRNNKLERIIIEMGDIEIKKSILSLSWKKIEKMSI